MMSNMEFILSVLTYCNNNDPQVTGYAYKDVTANPCMPVKCPAVQKY